MKMREHCREQKKEIPILKPLFGLLANAISPLIAFSILFSSLPQRLFKS